MSSAPSTSKWPSAKPDYNLYEHSLTKLNSIATMSFATQQNQIKTVSIPYPKSEAREMAKRGKCTLHKINAAMMLGAILAGGGFAGYQILDPDLSDKGIVTQQWLNLIIGVGIGLLALVPFACTRDDVHMHAATHRGGGVLYGLYQALALGAWATLFTGMAIAGFHEGSGGRRLLIVGLLGLGMGIMALMQLGIALGIKRLDPPTRSVSEA